MQTTPTTLDDWLAHCERLHTKNIELGLDRVRAVAQRLGLAFSCPVITVAGTNGKGSSCAMLEAVCPAGRLPRRPVHVKPHLVHFDERCRMQRRRWPRRQTLLLEHFQAVEAVRDGITLTWFEYTTLVDHAGAWPQAPPGPGDSGSGPGRPAGRGEHHRHRLRR
jgi:dihydrofolate synthase/folylpolyglutamate synthase